MHGQDSMRADGAQGIRSASITSSGRRRGHADPRLARTRTPGHQGLEGEFGSRASPKRLLSGPICPVSVCFSPASLRLFVCSFVLAVLPFCRFAVLPLLPLISILHSSGPRWPMSITLSLLAPAHTDRCADRSRSSHRCRRCERTRRVVVRSRLLRWTPRPTPARRFRFRRAAAAL